MLTTTEPSVDWKELHGIRAGKTLKLMEKLGLDAIVITTTDNIRYTSDWRPVPMLTELYNDEFASIFSSRGESYVFQPTVMEPLKNPAEDLPWVKELLPMPSWSPNPFVAEIWGRILSKKLKEIGAKQVGVEYMPFQMYEALKSQMPRAGLKSVFNDLLKLRAIKHSLELKILEYNASLLDECSEAGLSVVREGETEFRLATAISTKMWESGIEFMSHNLILSCRRTTIEWYHKRRAFSEGDSVLADIGFFGLGGYVTDMTRTITAGKPSTTYLEAYKVVKEAHLKGIKALVNGAKSSEVDGVIRKTIKEAGYPDTPYSNGHGIGLRCIEVPHIHKKEWMAQDTKIEPGMVVCIEPETYIEGRSIKLEDMVLVTDSGPRQLTHYQYMV
jgi:Xaa-Pro aminopeptidase